VWLGGRIVWNAEVTGWRREGARLKAHCESRLKAAQLRVEKIVVGPDGQAKGVEAAGFN
jgi:exonuclease VII small subunit